MECCLSHLGPRPGMQLVLWRPSSYQDAEGLETQILHPSLLPADGQPREGWLGIKRKHFLDKNVIAIQGWLCPPSHMGAIGTW